MLVELFRHHFDVDLSACCTCQVKPFDCTSQAKLFQHSIESPARCLEVLSSLLRQTWPEYSPSGAMKSSFFFPYWIGLLKVTCKIIEILTIFRHEYFLCPHAGAYSYCTLLCLLLMINR